MRMVPSSTIFFILNIVVSLGDFAMYLSIINFIVIVVLKECTASHAEEVQRCQLFTKVTLLTFRVASRIFDRFQAALLSACVPLLFQPLFYSLFPEPRFLMVLVQPFSSTTTA